MELGEQGNIAGGVCWAELCPIARGSGSPSKDRFDGETILVDNTPFVIGRAIECGCTTTNPAVSMQHCSIRWEKIVVGCPITDVQPEDPFRFYFKDLSSNGAYINGTKVGKNVEVALTEGDTIDLVKPRPELKRYQMSYTFLPKMNSAQRAVTRDVRTEYFIDDALGKGAFAVVRKGTSKTTGESVAIKIINLKKAEIQAQQAGDQTAKKQQAVFLNLSQPEKKEKPQVREESARDKQLREIDILKQLKHPNTIKIFDVFLSEAECYIVMELATGGDLFHLIKERGKISIDDSRIIFRQLISAVGYLHSEGIAHRDIKPENVLLGAPNDVHSIKLSDFGLAKNFGSHMQLKTTCGTPMYAAPEVVHREYDPEDVKEYHAKVNSGAEVVQRPEPLPYTPAVDVWSCGIVLWVMLTAQPPFPRKQVGDKMSRNMDYTAGLNFSTPPMPRAGSVLKGLINSMVRNDPTSRASIPQILANEWLKEGEEKVGEGSSLLTEDSEPEGLQPLKKRRVG